MKKQRYKFVWLLAKRDLIEDRKITVIVIAMLSFSFLNLVFFPAFVSGLSNAFTADLIETQIGHVSIQAEEGRLSGADAISESAGRLPGVAQVEKRLEFTATISHHDASRTVQVVGTSAASPSQYDERIAEGQFLSRTDENAIVLGIFVAEADEGFGSEGIGVEPGRLVTLSTDSGSMRLRVEGTIGRPGPSQLPQQAIIPYKTAEILLNAENEASSINILLDDADDADAFKTTLQTLNTPGEIQTWQERSEIADSIDATFAIVVAIISIVGLVIAVTSIGVVIFINTNKRAREMGIVRSIGAQRTRVIEIFMIEAFLFGAIGIVLGNGIMLAINSYLAQNPVVSPIGSISTELTASLLISRSAWMMTAALIAGFIPAYLTSKHDIIETMEAL